MMIINEMIDAMNILSLTGVGDVTTLLKELAFFGIPIGVTVWFIVSLITFLATPKEHEKRLRRKKLFIISSVIFGTLMLAVIGLIALLAFAIANM